MSVEEGSPVAGSSRPGSIGPPPPVISSRRADDWPKLPPETRRRRLGKIAPVMLLEVFFFLAVTYLGR